MTARSDFNKAGNIGPTWDADCDKARGEYLADLVAENAGDPLMLSHLAAELLKLPAKHRAAGMAALRALGTEAAA